MHNSQESSVNCLLCNGPQPAISDPESAELICSNCGMVISADKSVIDSRPQWGAIIEEVIQGRTRMGSSQPLSRHDMGLSTLIGMENRDGRGHILDTSMSLTAKRLRMWNYRTQFYKPSNRNLKCAFDRLDILKERLGLSDALAERTAYLYRKAYEAGLVGKRTISGILGAALYAAYREMGIPKDLDEIAAVINMGRTKMARDYRLMMTTLEIKVPIIDPTKCVVTVANKAGISERTRQSALFTVSELGLSSA